MSTCIIKTSQKPELSNKELELVMRLAKSGDLSAQQSLARLYDNGIGIPKNCKAAFKWYMRAAAQGCAYAQHRLSEMYRNGEGVLPDTVKAMHWLSKAAISGHRESRIQLHSLDHVRRAMAGEPVYHGAYIYFHTAKKDDCDARYALGVIYEKGMGVEPDLVKACKYYAWAEEGGCSEATKALKRLQKRMTAKQLQKARRKLRSRHKHNN